MFEEPEDSTTKSFFSEIISSISDVKFSSCGRYMISRDYLTVKVQLSSPFFLFSRLTTPKIIRVLSALVFHPSSEYTNRHQTHKYGKIECPAFF